MREKMEKFQCTMKSEGRGIQLKEGIASHAEEYCHRTGSEGGCSGEKRGLRGRAKHVKRDLLVDGPDISRLERLPTNGPQNCGGNGGIKSLENRKKRVRKRHVACKFVRVPRA